MNYAIKHKKQVTEWGHPMESLATEYGVIQYRDWLLLEIDRWKEKDFRGGWIEQNSEGLIAMFSDSNDVIDLPKEDAQ